MPRYQPLALLILATLALTPVAAAPAADADGEAGAAAKGVITEEFCLRGEIDLGVRLQGLRPRAGEWYPLSWCVSSEVDGPRVHFRAEGHANPDLRDDFTLAYLAPDRLRIVNQPPPDVEFVGASVGDEIAAIRRIDPARLLAELKAHPEWLVSEPVDGWRQLRWPAAEAIAEVRIVDGQLHSVRSSADVPLRGRVSVEWQWDWPEAATDGEAEGQLQLWLDGQLLFRAEASRRRLDAEETAALWPRAGEPEPIQAPGKSWPAAVRMRLLTLQPGVHLLRGVRTGFQHLVVETAEGLVVADAPAGWVELHLLPPRDLVPGLGVSGLSERMIEFLRGHFPQQPIRAVVLTHFHDDHAGGARAFAAAGATVYAPAASADFLRRALNRDSMPMDWLTASGGEVVVLGMEERSVIADRERPVELWPIPEGPHVAAALGLYLPTAKLYFQSDLHVPSSDDPEPRAGRVESDCWFAETVAATLPDETAIYNSHSVPAPTAGQVQAFVEHGSCQPKGTNPVD